MDGSEGSSWETLGDDQEEVEQLEGEEEVEWRDANEADELEIYDPSREAELRWQMEEMMAAEARLLQ
eukprot:scaffold159409_cov31-Prasinocladus_malaysianus.AAC.1